MLMRFGGQNIGANEPVLTVAYKAPNPHAALIPGGALAHLCITFQMLPITLSESRFCDVHNTDRAPGIDIDG